MDISFAMNVSLLFIKGIRKIKCQFFLIYIKSLSIKKQILNIAISTTIVLPFLD